MKRAITRQTHSIVRVIKILWGLPYSSLWSIVSLRLTAHQYYSMTCSCLSTPLIERESQRSSLHSYQIGFSLSLQPMMRVGADQTFNKVVQTVLMAPYGRVAALVSLVFEVKFLCSARLNRFKIRLVVSCHRVFFPESQTRKTTRQRRGVSSVQHLSHFRVGPLGFRLVFGRRKSVAKLP